MEAVRLGISGNGIELKQMGTSLTIRLPEKLAAWLSDTARKSGMSRGHIVRAELERAKASSDRPFLRLAGAIALPANLSTRKGFSRKWP